MKLKSKKIALFSMLCLTFGLFGVKASAVRVNGIATAFCDKQVAKPQFSPNHKGGCRGCIAVDPKKIPYGKHIKVYQGNSLIYEGVSCDVCGAAQRYSGYLVDLWFENNSVCNKFGKKNVTIVWDEGAPAPAPRPVPAPAPAPVQVVNHAGTAFSSTIRQRGCCKGDGHPELCVDAAAENNGKIQLWHYLGGANQKWDFVPSGTGPDEYYIISKAPWLTGGHAYLTQRNQAEVIYERGRNAREQIWKFIRTDRENFWLIKNVATGKYLDSGPHGNHRDRGDVYTNGRCEREQIWSLM